MRFKRTKIYSGVVVALGSALLVSAPASQAQQAEQRVEVTGSRIRSIGTVSNSPITSVTAEEFGSSQPVVVEEVIRGLSVSYPAIGAATNNGSNGTASVDLRGLGSNRTLVLINGRRMVPATLGGVVDTNSIPVSLLDRIDLVTGGASAVYGADAVSGVVNFVFKKNFTGIEATTSYNVSDKNDAKRFRNDVTIGADLADGRGNVVLNVGSTRTQPLRQGERDFGFYQLNSVTGARDGSSTSVPSILAGMPAPLNGSRAIDLASGTLRAATAADNYNFNPLNYYITPLDRTQVNALGRFTINEMAEAYAELTNTKSTVTLNLAPSGSFTNTYSLPIGNPFVPEAMRQQLCSAYGIAAAQCVAGNPQEISLQIRRRFTELGPRINTYDNTTTQWTAGVRGVIPVLGSWNYDAYLQKGTADAVSNRINWGSLSKVQQALRATNATTCTSTLGGCVPLNLFGAEGSITPAMLKFVNLSAVQTTFVEQNVANVSVSGEVALLKSPFASSPMNLALGLEMRKVNAGNRSDAPSQIQGEVLGTGAPLPDRTGTLKLDEGFIEAIMPLASGRPGAQAVNLELGYRSSNFKTEVSSKSYGSWKYGMDWAPIKGLRLRGMQQRATRAPNINELYAPVTTGLSNLGTDPCQGNKINTAEVNTPGTLSYLCNKTGVPLNQVGFVAPPSAGQINNTAGGNPDLGPEEADTTTLGLVFEPTALPGLTASLDFFKIAIDKAVSNPTTSQVLGGCYTPALNPTLAPDNVFCGLLRRDATGGLNNGLGVITQSSNLGKYLVEGYDVEVKYRLPLKSFGIDPKWGRLDLGITLSEMTKWQFKSLPSVATLDCLGRYGLDCGSPYHKTRFTQRTTWYAGNYTLGYVWRHLGKVSVQDDGGGWLPEFSEIKAFDYVDLNASWDVTKNLRVALAVNNAFDKKPPVVGNTIGGTGPNSGNTFPLTYDVVGRAYALSARLKF